MSIPMDGRYIPAFSIEDVLLDKDTGAPLSGGQVFFEQDNQRGTLKPVFQITGTSPDYTFTQLPNPMILSSIGTFEDSLGNPVIPYFFPFDSNDGVELYYVRVLNANDVPQFTREAVPYIPEDLNPIDGGDSGFANELSNPQFATVLFDTYSGSKVFTLSGSLLETEIAPDWTLVTTGTGTVTLTQITPSGTLNIPTNPGTILGVDVSGGFSVVQLRQRLYGSPNLWSNGNVASTIVLKSISAGSPVITMDYKQSGVVSEIELLSASLSGNDDYKQFYGHTDVEIPPSTSSDTFPDAYVDITINLPSGTNIGISSVQVTFTGSQTITELPYDQETNARQIDHQYNYDKPRLDFKPVPSLLTGWDFPLNPMQFSDTSFSTTPKYIWDQTICASAVGTVNVARNTTTGEFQATTTNATEAFYLLQYLQGAQALKTTMSNLAVNLNAYTLVHQEVVATVYLFFSSGGGTIPTASTLAATIGSIASDGTFTLTPANNWSAITQVNGNASSCTLPLTTPEDFGFSGWDGGENFGLTSTTTTTNFAIVVTFAVPTSGTVVNVQSIGLVPGDIPTRPAPQTPDEVLRECKYYYQTSFLPGVTAAAAVGLNSGESYGIQVEAPPNTGIGPIVRYAVPLRRAPITPQLFNPVNNNTNIYNSTSSSDWSNSAVAGSTANGFYTQGTVPNPTSAQGDLSQVHWLSNARLGNV